MMADTPWVPPHLKPPRPLTPLRRELPDNLPALEVGDRVRITEHPDGMTVQTEWGIIDRPHPTWRGYYLVQMDKPVLIPRMQGPAESVDLIAMPADRLMGLRRCLT